MFMQRVSKRCERKPVVILRWKEPVMVLRESFFQQFLKFWIFQFFRFQLLKLFELKQQFFKL